MQNVWRVVYIDWLGWELCCNDKDMKPFLCCSLCNAEFVVLQHYPLSYVMIKPVSRSKSSIVLSRWWSDNSCNLNVMRTILLRLSCGKNSKCISTAAVNQWDSRAHEEEVQVQYLLWTMINGAQSSDEHDQHAAWESLLCVALKYNTEQTISRRLSSLQSIVPVLCGNILYTLMFEDLNCILVFK